MFYQWQILNSMQSQSKSFPFCLVDKEMWIYLVYQFSTDLWVAYPCYLESQWVQS